MKLKLIQPDLAFEAVPRPRQIVTESGEEFLDLCDRAKAGELVIEAVSVGRTPGQWIADVRWRGQS